MVIAVTGETAMAAGTIAIEVKFSTVRVAVFETVPNCAFTVAVPAATPVTSPVLSTVATEPSLGETLHAAARLMGCFVPSLKVPTAFNRRVEPIATPELGGASAIDVSEAELTVRLAFPDIPPSAAVIVVVPEATPVATPLGAVFVTVAAAVSVLPQLASAVMSCVVPSLNIPRAERFRRVSGAIVWNTGETTMEVTVAFVTSSVDVPARLVVGSVAVIVAAPAVMPVARPALLIVATLTRVELQVTELVMLRSPPSV
jgi:hypothetical protein